MNINFDDRISGLADSLAVWRAVAVVGAGVSARSGLPLCGQLSPLLWQAFDSDLDAKAKLMAVRASSAPTTKELIGDNDTARQTALRLLPAHEKARSTFQHAFTALDSAHDAPSPTYDRLAEWLHRGVLGFIVSLNWDTQFEKAYERRYGRRVQASGPEFYKVHGDAAFPNDRWTYPGESSCIPNELLNRVAALPNERPMLLLVIGYSESDEDIVRQLIQPLAERWKVVRIGPDATEPEDIPLKSEMAVPQIHSRMALAPETTGWEYVRFSTQADLGAALSGYSLGPSHVFACPRLPEVDVILRQLSISKRVTLTGKAGSGKSITGYQVAYSLSEDGWEVLRPGDDTHSMEQLLLGVSDLSHKSLLLLDDAHRMDKALRRNIEECANANIAVLTILTEEIPEHANSVPIAGRRAVQILARALLERRRETLEIVRKLDNHVGDGYGDIRLEDRIAEASKAESPWQFNFILTGGWRRATQEVAALRDMQRADLLLLGLAAAHLRMLGAGVDEARLGRIVRAIGRDEAWLEHSKELLCRRRMLMSRNDLRCPHLKLSIVALNIGCGLPKDTEWPLIIAVLRLILCEKSSPFRGIWWLLDELRFADGFRWSRTDLVDEPTWRTLVERCWTASTEDRGDACVLLESLIDWYPAQLNELKDNVELLRQWFENADAQWCIGASRLLNSIHNADQALGVKLCEDIRPKSLAHQLSLCRVADGYSWGHFLDRIGVAGGKAWRHSLGESLDVSALESLTVDITTDDQLWHLTQLAFGVNCINTVAALRMISRLSSRIAERINRAPAQADGEFSDVFWRILGYAPHFLRFHHPKPEQRRVARAIIRRIDKKSVARAISEAQRWALEPLARLTSLIFEIEPRSTSLLLSGLNLSRLDEELGREWERPRHELQVLLSVLAVGEDREPARSWITRHASELQILTPRLGWIAPTAAVDALRRGIELPLELSHGLDWIGAAAALYAIAQVDADLARAVVMANRDQIMQGLHLPQPNSCEKLPEFCEVIGRLMPGQLESMLNELDAAAVESRWQARLRGKAEERKAANVLLSLAVRGTGPVALIAKRLLASAGNFARPKRLRP